MALEFEQQQDDIANLLNALEKLEPEIAEKQTDIQFLKDFVSSNDFRILLKAHNTVRIVDHPSTEQSAVLASSRMLMYDLEDSSLSSSPQSEELLELLSSTLVNSLLATFDKVSNKEYPLQSVMAEDIIATDERDDCINTIRIVKGARQKLGATVKADNVGNILIGRIIHGTVADRCGLLHSGDVIHEINKTKLQGKTIDDVGDIMRSLEGLIEMKVSSEYSLLPNRKHQATKHMKTLFSYDPKDDVLQPCEELGLQMNERDIITVYNGDDPEWWQAKVEGETKIGLIPSAKMRERMYYEEANRKQATQRPLRNKNKKGTMYNPMDCEELGGREVLSYEEVVKIQPQRMQPRPIILIAPKCQPFAISDVKTKLIFSDHRRYAGPVPHTSRPPRTNEIDRQHYHFLSKEEMRRKIISNQFVEHGEQGGHFYGLSITTVRSIINQGKIGVMTIVPRALKLIHQSAELKPYVIFFKPPSDNDIHKYWIEIGLIQENDLPDIKKKTDTMMSLYGQYFDTILPYCNTDGAVIDIQRITEKLLEEPQWIPAIWIA